jgi:hypothetical protein
MTLKRIAIRASAACIFAMAASACSTDYHDMGLFGGVEAVRIDSNTMRISARGNRFTDIRTMKDYVLLKSAEETVAQGYDLFELTGTENVTRTEQYSSTSYHFVPVTTFGPNGPNFGSARVPSSSSDTVILPGEDIVIKMFKGQKPADAPENVFAAREVIAFLGPHILGNDFAKEEAVANASDDQPSIASVQSTPPQATAVTQVASCDAKQDAKLAELARANGYQYRSNCNEQSDAR